MLNYTTYTQQLANLMVIPTTDANFQTFLPGCIDYAEQRIYRDLQLLDTEVRDSGGSVAANNRTFTLPNTYGNFIIVHGMNLFTSPGNRQQMVPASRNFVDFLYPSETASTSPSYPGFFAMVTDQQVLVAPPADQVYNVEVVGTIRPTPLSTGNSSTYLTSHLPDLFIAASMVFATGYQRDFGAETDDPKSAVSWESQYQTLLQNANNEETRKKYNATFGGVA